MEADPLEQARARITACGDLWPGTDLHQLFQACVVLGIQGNGAADDASDAIYQRLLQASTCEDLQRALPGLLSAQLAFTGDYVCDDGVGYRCEEGRLTQGADCAADGAICSTDGPVAECAPPTGVCDASSPMRSCAEGGGLCLPANNSSYGNGMSSRFVDCAAKGLTCGSTATGSFECLMPAPSCSGFSQWTCEGETTVFCEGAQVGRPVQHCGRVPGLGCTGGACHAEVTDCSERTPPTCDGDLLRYRFKSSTRVSDCASLGTTCVQDEQGARCLF